MDEAYHTHHRYSHQHNNNNNNNDPYYSPRPQQPRYRRSVPSSLDRKTISYLTPQNFGILVAILVIYLFQRKDGFGRLLQARRERGRMNALMDLLLEMHDYIIGYGQMVMEVCRNVRCHLLAHGGDDFIYDMSSSMPASPADSSFHVNNNGGFARCRRRNNSNRGPAAESLIMASGGIMPDLEETEDEPMDSTTAEHYYSNKENTDPVEPAFLRDEDYPPGWLVFDPVLGVVSKAEADRHKREQTQKKEQQQPTPAATKSPIRQQPQQQSLHQQKQQHATPQQQPKAKPTSTTTAQTTAPATTTRPLRTNNVMPNTSAMHTPHSIAANG